MKYNRLGKEEVSLLGLGAMRLPERDGKVDEEAAVELIRHAIREGINYVDTGYAYHRGQSEVVVGKALRDGYREKVVLADKCPIWHVKSREDFFRFFREQCGRLGVTCIDNYLIHGFNQDRWELFRKLNLYEAMCRLKEEGKIRYISFSFHDTNRLFREIIDTYKWDMCQIQLNYMDRNMQAGVDGLRYAAERGVAVAVMEPLRGGRLTSNIPEAVRRVWDNAPSRRSPARWAFDWVAAQKGVTLILSGMSSMEQLTENLEIFHSADLGRLTEDEEAVIEQAAHLYGRLIKHPCTFCKYCMPCPQKIEIPRVIDFYNSWFIYDKNERIRKEYRGWLFKHGSDCVDCRACEKQCPQGLPITQIMKDAQSVFGM